MSKTQSTHQYRLVLVSMLALAPSSVMAQANTKPSYMHGGKAQSITITSNVAKAGIMEDGLFVGYAGAAFDSAVGVHELIVSAQGYVPRLVRVNLTSTDVTQNVNLAPVPDKNIDVEIDYSAAKTFVTKQALSSIPSLCATYNRAPEKVSRDLMLNCRRETILDDFDAFGRSWLPPPQADEDPSVAEQRQSLMQTIAKAQDDAFYWQAEKLYATLPADAHAATLLAFSAATRQDCTRVLEVAVENGSYKKVAPGLIFVRGLCFEMANQADKAARLYLHLAAGKEPPTDMLYHLARVQSPVAAPSAIKTLRVCTKTHPSFYPCYEAMAQVQAIAGNIAAAKATMTLSLKRTRAALSKIFVNSKLDPAAVNAAFAERPESFELAAAASIVNTKPGAPRPTIPLDSMLISDPAIVKQLVSYLEDQVSPATLTPIYMLLTRHFPNDATSWIRLAAAYRVGDRCSESLEASTRALTLMHDDRRRSALLVSTTECLVRLEKIVEAETILLQVTASGETSWKAYYNLGVVQRRLGKTEAALGSFETALSGEMPRTTRTRVENMILHFRAIADEKKGLKDAAPAAALPTH